MKRLIFLVAFMTLIILLLNTLPIQASEPIIMNKAEYDSMRARVDSAYAWRMAHLDSILWAEHKAQYPTDSTLGSAVFIFVGMFVFSLLQ